MVADLATAAVAATGRVWPRHAPRLPALRPCDFGIGMTVCIAAICDAGQTILTASDTMMTVGPWTVDVGMLKARRLYQSWAVLFAGDTTPALPILERAAELLSPNPRATMKDVRTAMITAYREEVSDAIDSVLFPHRLDLPTLDRDKSILPSVRRSLRRDVNRIKREFDCTFLVCGFDAFGPHIFVVKPPGKAERVTQVGYWAIGSGARLAMQCLVEERGYNAYDRLPLCVYRVCEAKFAAEADPHVGRSTFVAAVRSDGTCTITSGLKIDPEIRASWEAEGKPAELSDLPGRMLRLFTWGRLPS